MGRPNASYATQEEIKRLTEALREVDRKRLDDAERIHAELKKLGDSLEASAQKLQKRTPPPTPEKKTPEKSATPEKGFEYTVEKGDTLSLIVQAYREKNIKITTDQILKANPGLKPEKLSKSFVLRALTSCAASMHRGAAWKVRIPSALYAPALLAIIA
jgi:LysM repeat protein